jgi:hypothetical protein
VFNIFCSKETVWNPALFTSAKDNDFSNHAHLSENGIHQNYQIGFPKCEDFKVLRNDEDIW